MEGLERIKALASEVTDEVLLDIINYLLSREDMNEKYLNEEKSLKQMIKYIQSEAKKKAHDGCAMLRNEEVYGLAIHYFDESNDKLNLDSNKENEETEPKNDDGVEVSPIKVTIEKKKEKQKKEWIPEGQLTLF